MFPYFIFFLTLLTVQTSRDRMATKAGHDYLTLLVGRILETESARANALREFRRLDDLLTTIQTKFNKLANRAAPVYSIPNEILSEIFEQLAFHDRDGHLLSRSIFVCDTSLAEMLQ